MTKEEIFLQATKAVERKERESRNYREKVMKALKKFSAKHPELKGRELLIAFRDSGSKYAEAYEDDEPFEFAYSL